MRTLVRLLSESPEIGLAQAKLRSDEITLRRERVEPIPNVFVEGAAGYNFPESDTVFGVRMFIRVPVFEGLLLINGLAPPPGVSPPGHIDAVASPR